MTGARAIESDTGRPAPVLALGGPGEKARELVGGKAASVDWLIREGFPSPPAACVTTRACDAYLAEHDLVQRVEELASRLPDEDARRELSGLYRSPLPPSVAADLEEAVSAVGKRAGAASMLAVRSSAVEEDSEAASFAGQHATFLGVGAREVERRVRDCWASLWSAEAVSYRLSRGLGFERASMAVLLQPLMRATMSAVVFTENPVSGARDELLVCAVNGLGEPLVSGKVTPATVVIDKATLRTREATAGRNELVLVADGESVRYDDGERGRELRISEVAVAPLVRTATEVEARAGRPVDIESAYAAGRWQLLQVRPITRAP